MKTITVRKDLTINTGNFSNVKIGVEISTDKGDWKEAWAEVNSQLIKQEELEKQFRLPKFFPKKDLDEKELTAPF
jgi:hypothetical protein